MDALFPMANPGVKKHFGQSFILQTIYNGNGLPNCKTVKSGDAALYKSEDTILYK